MKNPKKIIFDGDLKRPPGTENFSLENYKTKLEEMEQNYVSMKEELEMTKSNFNLMMREVIKYEKQAMLGKFISILSNDIRTPLATIQGAIEVMELRSSVGSSELDKHFTSVKQSIQKIVDLVEDVSNYVRDEPLDISYNSVLDIIRSSLIAVNLPPAISVSLPKNDSTLLCDRQKLESVFVHLLISSSDVMQQNGKIEFRINDTADNVEILFSHSGPGIPEADLDRIFDPLFARIRRGVGLGLASCKKIIEAHNGDISVQNDPTTFTILLPKDNLEYQ